MVIFKHQVISRTVMDLHLEKTPISETNLATSFDHWVEVAMEVSQDVYVLGWAYCVKAIFCCIPLDALNIFFLGGESSKYRKISAKKQARINTVVLKSIL